MNCEKCQNLLSDWLDNELPAVERIALGAHLSDCVACRTVHDELNTIVGFCATQRGVYDPVPNQQALWRRISNTIEAEQQALARETAKATATPPKSSRWAAWWQNSWQFSLPQLASAVTVLALAVALGTMALTKYSGTIRGLGREAVTQFALGGNRGETLVQQRQHAVDYWRQRVEQRKASWNPQMRAAFDYNLAVLDNAIKESRDELGINPHDEISEERLNAALEDKLELLKEFGE
jgi:predicted anti-sigma-YlaC factor YlaD